MDIKSSLTAIISPLLVVLIAACDQKPSPGSAPTQAPRETSLGHGYVRRDGAIHFIGGGTTGTGENATRIDTPSLELIKQLVYSQYGPFKTCEGLDPDTFEALSEEYTRDKNRVYYKVGSDPFIVVLLPDADPVSFEVLNTDLARDKNHVWIGDRLQSQADPATLVMLDGGDVIKDKDSVHHGETIIHGADPDTFTHLGSAYYRDKTRVYWGPEPVAGADSATFEVLGDSFVAKDKDHVYRSGERLPGIDANTLALILHDPAGHQVLSDKNGIHLMDMPFPRAKPGPVEIIDNLTLAANDLVLLVESSRNTPVTIFRENGILMAEAPAYEPETREIMGTITATVTEHGLENIVIAPLPGSTTVPEVADWQMECFNNPSQLQRYLDAGKRIK